MSSRAVRMYLAVGALLVGAGGFLSLRAQEPPAPAQRHVVALRDFAFEPSQLTVAPGDTVVWVNHDIVPHTATASNDAWDSGTLQDTASWYLVVQAPGRHDYYCRFHPTMTGTLVAE